MAAAKINREGWLLKAVQLYRPVFKKAGHPIPEKVRVAVAFPSTRALSSTKARIGECWSDKCSGDGACEIMISPRLADPLVIIDTLVHELCHAAVGTEAGHKGPFVKLARALGLEGKPTSTHGGEEFRKQAAIVLKKLGPLPHAALTASRQRKVQTTRLIKCQCAECGYIARTTTRWIEEAGAPLCPCNNEPMEVK